MALSYHHERAVRFCPHHRTHAFKTLLLRITSNSMMLAMTSQALFTIAYKTADNVSCVPKREVPQHVAGGRDGTGAPM